ncbi:MAG: hypothetical protein ACLT0A_10140 [Holdemanella porci]
MEKIFEGAISCKALLEAGSRDCKKLYIDKKKKDYFGIGGYQYIR